MELYQRYELGVPEIDNQHRQLFAWYVAVRQVPDAQQVVDGLVAYADFHFASEESWAADRGVDIMAHHDQHNQLLIRLDSLLANSNRIGTMALLQDWITAHIDSEDRILVADALSQG